MNHGEVFPCSQQRAPPRHCSAEAFEDARQMALIGKARRLGNVSQWQFQIAEQLRSAMNAQLLLVFADSLVVELVGHQWLI